MSSEFKLACIIKFQHRTGSFVDIDFEQSGYLGDRGYVWGGVLDRNDNRTVASYWGSIEHTDADRAIEM